MPANGVVEAAPRPQGGSAARPERTAVQPKPQTRSPLHSARSTLCSLALRPRCRGRSDVAAAPTLRCLGWHVISDVPEGVQPRKVSGWKAESRGVTLRNRWPSRLELYPAVCEGGGTL